MSTIFVNFINYTKKCISNLCDIPGRFEKQSFTRPGRIFPSLYFPGRRGIVLASRRGC